MEELRTEEEQIAAIKNWWKENGNSILIAIGLALAIVFGWKAYQNNALQNKAEASAMYDQLLTAATRPQLAGEASSVSYLADALKAKFSDTEYGIYAALFLAKEAVNADDLELAKTELNWVLSNTDDTSLVHVINGRLARILSQQGDQEGALALLHATDSAFDSEYLELQGDIKLRAKDEAGAVDAYKKAFALVKSEPQVQPLLAIKLADLGVSIDSL